MSLKIVVPGFTFTGPKILTDKIESSGSMMLIEPASPSYPWANGVPVSGSALNNVLSNRAQTLGIYGLPVITNLGLDGAYGKLERTSKGGLHGIAARTGMVSGKGAKIELPNDLVQYIINNSSHEFYYSAWFRMTRLSTAQQPSRFIIGANGTTKMHTYWYKGQLAPTSTGRVSANNTSAGGVLDSAIQAITVNQWTGGVPATPSEVERSFQWGSITPINNGYLYNDMPSWVLYRAYIEDLTVSGRSHASVFSLDNALYTEAFGVGGRYYNDTYTDPATIP